MFTKSLNGLKGTKLNSAINVIIINGFSKFNGKAINFT